MTDNNPTQYESLQYLRGFAALMVIYIHAVLQIGILDNQQVLFPVFGSCGVDIFFVLSGFVMWVSHPPERRETPLGFYKRRILRVAPLYWVVTLFSVIVALTIPSVIRSLKVEPDHVLASLFFVPWPNPAFPVGSSNHVTPVIIPGWTLNFEMFFYALFGLTLPFAQRARVAILLCAFASLWIWTTLSIAPSTAGSFYASGFLLEFVFGIFVAMLCVRVRIIASVGLLGLLLGFVGLITAELFLADRFLAIARGLPAALIVFSAVVIERSGALRSLAVAGLVGDASYSIYLTHGFVIAAMRAIWQHGKLPFDLSGQTAFVGLCLLLGTLGGVLVYRHVERPMLRFALRRRHA